MRKGKKRKEHLKGMGMDMAMAGRRSQLHAVPTACCLIVTVNTTLAACLTWSLQQLVAQSQR